MTLWSIWENQMRKFGRKILWNWNRDGLWMTKIDIPWEEKGYPDMVLEQTKNAPWPLSRPMPLMTLHTCHPLLWLLLSLLALLDTCALWALWALLVLLGLHALLTLLFTPSFWLLYIHMFHSACTPFPLRLSQILLRLETKTCPAHSSELRLNLSSPYLSHPPNGLCPILCHLVYKVTAACTYSLARK